ncbi:MAG: hypothetical protein IIB56_07580 [Planctomycetes bacterium]|nr:hypothetical protein [Planctomycetota bacterium]MCH8119488.1 hypothetical protein [Planctomycetota bacterium]
MRILTAVFLVAMAGFFGCGGRSVCWYNPDRTLKQAEGDCRECHYQAQAEAIEAAWRDRLDWGIRGRGPVYRDLQFDRCMKQKGYCLVPEDELSFPTRKRLFQVAGEWYYPIAGN